MTIFWIFISTYALVFALGMQSQHVNKGHYKAAFINSLIIGLSNLVLYKSVPNANPTEVAAYLTAGPIAIVHSMWAHRKYFKQKENHGQC